MKLFYFSAWEYNVIQIFVSEPWDSGRLSLSESILSCNATNRILSSI